MIHTASLVHDDVLDDCDTRRGASDPPCGLKPCFCMRLWAPVSAHDKRALVCADAGKQTINSLYGTRVAVLAGDFLFAQSSWFLANLDNLEVGRGSHCVHSAEAPSGCECLAAPSEFNAGDD
jgi:all-trans-nonaprenyl-diphosphate synthase